MNIYLVICLAILAAALLCLAFSYQLGKAQGAEEARMHIARTVASSPLQGELWIAEAKLALTQAAIKDKLTLWGGRIALPK